MDLETKIREVLSVVVLFHNRKAVDVGTKRIMEIIQEEVLKDGNETPQKEIDT